MISWTSRKQSFLVESSSQVGYIATSMGTKEDIWLRKLIVELFGKPLKPTTILCANQSCIKLSENPVFHDPSKHIEIPFHYVRDMVEGEAIQLGYINTSDQTADILTKPLSRIKVEHFRKKLGMVEM